MKIPKKFSVCIYILRDPNLNVIMASKKKRCKANNDVQDHQWESSYSEGSYDQGLERPPSWGSNSAVSQGLQSLTDKAELNSYISGGEGVGSVCTPKEGVGSVCTPKSWHYNQLDDCGHYMYQAETEKQ